jgi:hypothetical protein
MANNNIQVLVNTGNPDTNKTVEVLQGSGKRGTPTTIKAVKGARYQLEEQTAKNTAPENIRSKRDNKLPCPPVGTSNKCLELPQLFPQQ